MPNMCLTTYAKESSTILYRCFKLVKMDSIPLPPNTYLLTKIIFLCFLEICVKLTAEKCPTFFFFKPLNFSPFFLVSLALAQSF